MAEKKKLAIIDGKSVFYRGYYAMPNLSTGDGVPTGGVYGFASMALELLKKLQPDYVCVAWDKPKTNIRKRLQMYPDYKAGRKPAPPDFYTQIPILHDLLDAFGWPLYELDDYEADDIMGTLALQAEKKDIETLLITSDLDVLQLVTHHVRVYALKKGFSNIEEFRPESFEAKYGLKATQFLDLKALKGDSSDNIPGVPGIGEKGAIDLLKQYKTLDGVYENVDLVKESMRKKLEAGKDSAYLSKKIAAIWCDAPMKLNLKEMEGKNIDVKHLRKLLEDLEFRSLLARLPENMQSPADRAGGSGNSKLTLPKHTHIGKDDELPKLKLSGSKLYIQAVAAGAQGQNPQLLVLGDGQQAYSLDLSKLTAKKVQAALSPVFKGVSLVGFDVKSDLKVLAALGIEAPPVGHDVQVAAYLIDSLSRALSPNDLAELELDYQTSSFSDTPIEDLPTRAAEMVALLRDLEAKQLTKLAKMPKVAKVAKEIEWPLVPVLTDMEMSGIKLNTDYLKKFSKQLEGSISDIEQKIYGHADQEFNIGSPAQLADVLFNKLNLPTQGIKKTKSGFSTAASELDKLRGQHPIIDLVTQYREMAKLKNTYVDPLPTMVDAQSRLHTTYIMTGAPTGRLASVEPNLMAIPVRTDLGRNIRTAFVAEKGNALISADYSQFELRIAAALTGDKSMIDAFNQDADIHVTTAAQIYNIKPEQVTKTQRSSVKEVNFGIMYGLGPHALSQSTGMSFGEARQFIDRYFEIRPNLKKFIAEVREQAEKDGYVETLLGRRRPTPDVKSSNFVVREAAYRGAVNMPFQGTAADIMKLAMVQVAAKLPKEAKMLLQIHDSLILEVPKAKAEKVSDMVKETMENTYTKLPVKLKADISIGQNWGEL